MSYNPGNRFMGPEFLAVGIKDAADERRRRKENDALVKGFMQMHQASPELQRILPVRDWGEVAPNQIKGWLQGLELQQAEQQQAQQQALAAEQAAAQQQAAEQAAAQQQAQQAALMEVLQNVDQAGAPMTPQAQYLASMAGQGGGQMDSRQIMDVLGGLSGPRAFDGAQYADTDILLAPTGNVINRGTQGASGPPQVVESGGHQFYERGGQWFPLREDTGVSNLRPDDVLRHERRRRATAAQIEELQKKADNAWTERGKAQAQREMELLEAEIAAIDGVLSGVRRPARTEDGTAEAPPPAAGNERLLEEAIFWSQARQFSSVEEAQAARAAGYRGPAFVAGRRVIIE